ncbi:cation:proton antiporter [Spirosoma rhododendri]|uniref:Sodium:proton antiporter n=1 Tax=Spirosoma rhododendri TaxID=2728024 RepID=A0A7L5DQ74_9BACT|nr:sodium:proton antiporter [Spirosoma rhododendri]QJD79722.1 sodium:proton antiporter [Spirosoma rhododendri]
MAFFDLFTILLVIAAAFAYLNTRLLKLPGAIGVMAVSLAFSALLLVFNSLIPDAFATIREAIAGIDFYKLLFNVMLSLLLFAGAFHTDASKLRVERRSVMLFAFVGVLISTGLVGTALYYAADGLGYELPYTLCLLFGALISPTDPVAVLGILARFDLPEQIKTNIVGESLFNDGVGVVIFATLYQLVESGSTHLDPGKTLLFFLEEAGGGVLLGLAIGYGMYWLLRSVNEYQTEVLITVAGVMGGYLMARHLHVSGPLAMVVAGLLVGDQAREDALSHTTEEYLDKFWELIDSILNALLFVLIGLELLVIPFERAYLMLSLLAVLITLLARYLSILIPVSLARRWIDLGPEAPVMLTWGGLRGGLSIAMALSIDNTIPHKDIIVTITYAVVLFSVLGQGLTMERLIRRLYP